MHLKKHAPKNCTLVSDPCPSSSVLCHLFSVLYNVTSDPVRFKIDNMAPSPYKITLIMPCTKNRQLIL